MGLSRVKKNAVCPESLPSENMCTNYLSEKIKQIMEIFTHCIINFSKKMIFF